MEDAYFMIYRRDVLAPKAYGTSLWGDKR